jgi:hypothetical protein
MNYVLAQGSARTNIALKTHLRIALQEVPVLPSKFALAIASL